MTSSECGFADLTKTPRCLFRAAPGGISNQHAVAQELGLNVRPVPTRGGMVRKPQQTNAKKYIPEDK